MFITCFWEIGFHVISHDTDSKEETSFSLNTNLVLAGSLNVDILERPPIGSIMRLTFIDKAIEAHYV